MKRLILIFVSFVWLPFMTAEAEGCSCLEYDVPVCAAYWRADAVFAGQLLNITPVEKTSDSSMPTVMLHFIVEQPFRGVAGNRVDVETLHGTSCDMNFSKGERYLIYAARDQGSNQLFAGPCMGTTNLEHATDDLNYIRTVTQQEAKESILGRLLHEKYQPIPGIRVTVQDGDKSLEARTNEKGDYSITVPGPGNYIVRAFIPFAAVIMSPAQENKSRTETTDSLTSFEFEVKVEKNQCHYTQIATFKQTCTRRQKSPEMY
ncbi:MAG TPA: carboxypeptidase-like regulatory domain-containing protein [Pyrinomonadaceae bacterium]|nr:carboxypeptidase-like regulatory domain-containing protein [Pyrinomonadaceae bacterium]